MALLIRATENIFFISNNCYSKLTLNYSKIESYKKYFFRILTFNKYYCNTYDSRIDFCNETKKKEKKTVTFSEVLAQRRLEACRSVLIEVQSDKSCLDVYNYCLKFGKINGLFHYIKYSMSRHFVLIEFEREESINAIINASTHINHNQIFPVYSTMLWFRNDLSKDDLEESKKNDPVTIPWPLYKDSCKTLNDIQIFKLLNTAQNISDQIMLLYQKTKLNDVGVRLRFYTAYQLERSFFSLFPNIVVIPFGSSVNGFGEQNCDLDLFMNLDNKAFEKMESRLIFQTKSALNSERLKSKKLLELIAETMNVFLPGITNIQKILNARVPIIKFDHVLTGIECDLSFISTGYYMSQLLYMCGEIDWRVRPLTFVIRKWAQVVRLTRIIPGVWITNFSLSLMVLFYLQQKKVLPPFNLFKLESNSDISMDNNLKSNFGNPNTSLEKLLLDFYIYYGNFDFETQALSLKEGKPILKPKHSVLYICNPMDTSSNVSQNVNFAELERLKVTMRSAAWTLESLDYQNCKSRGLVNLFTNEAINEKNVEKQNMQSSLDLKKLFETVDDFRPNRKRKN